jgi:acetoin utilization protein AcuB
MIPFEELHILRTDQEVGTALQQIIDNGFLSLPVIDEQDHFVGVLSRRYIYEEFFNNLEYDKETFFKRKVSEFIKAKIPVTKDNIFIEEAALLLFEKKMTFLPIVDEHSGKLKGIITSGKLLEKYKDFFGLEHPKLVMYIYDFKGKLAQIMGIISKAGGSIKNIVQTDTEVMGYQEITLRVESNDIHKVVKQLRDHGIEIREFCE